MLDKVAPVKIIKKDQDWYTGELQDRETARSEGQRKKKTKVEEREWRRQKNKLGRDLSKAKMRAMQIKVKNKLG